MTARGIRGRLPGAGLVGKYAAPAVLVLAITMLGLALSGVLLPAHGAIPPSAYDYSHDGASAAEGGLADTDRSVRSWQDG